jgi:hypothetical protein
MPQFALEALQVPDPLHDEQVLSPHVKVSPAPLQVLQMSQLLPIPLHDEQVSPEVIFPVPKQVTHAFSATRGEPLQDPHETIS